MPFARRGLRRALSLAVLVALFFPIVYEVLRQGVSLLPMAGVAVPSALAVAGFVLPVLRVRERIRAAKARTRMRLRGALSLALD